MRRDELAQLPEYWGIFFDPETGITYREDGTATGYTFERARWTGPFGLHMAWPFLNPLAFATHETAVKVLAFAQALAPKTLSVSLDEERRDLGPFTRTVERLIVVTDGGRTENFAAGWIANSIIRNGERVAGDSLKAEWRHAGFTV